jgi:hypothetical protein
MADFSIPQVQVPNMAALYQEGQQVGRQNALTAAMQQYGGAAVMGDQNALAAIAQFDPQAALDLMSGRQQMDLRERADNRSERSYGLEQERHGLAMAEGNQAMEIARQRAREATEAHKANMTGQQRELAMQEIQLIGAFGNVGSEQEWDALADRLQIPDLKGQFDQRDALVGMAMGVSEALAGPGEPFTLSPGEERFDGRGNQIAAVPDGGATDDIKEWQFAVQEGGYTGSFADWQTKNREISVGTPPAGFALEYDESGRPSSMVPIPGSPAALEAEQARIAAENKAAGAERTSDIVLEDIGRAKALVEGAPWYSPAAGFGSGLWMNVAGSPAVNVKALTDTIKANVGFDRLAQMRAESPAGGALGSITERELQLLSSVLGSLEQSQGEAQLIENLDRLNQVYDEIKRKASAYPNAGRYGFGGEQTGGAPAAPARIRFNPETGEFE